MVIFGDEPSLQKEAGGEIHSAHWHPHEQASQLMIHESAQSPQLGCAVPSLQSTRRQGDERRSMSVPKSVVPPPNDPLATPIRLAE
jgi:hypothetical protein